MVFLSARAQRVTIANPKLGPLTAEKSLRASIQPTPFPYTNLDGWALYMFALPRKIEFGLYKEIKNLESRDNFRIIRNVI